MFSKMINRMAGKDIGKAKVAIRVNELLEELKHVCDQVSIPGDDCSAIEKARCDLRTKEIAAKALSIQWQLQVLTKVV